MNNRSRHKSKIYIVKRTRTHDGGGGHTFDWDFDNKTEWRASVRGATARDVRAASREESRMTHVINPDSKPIVAIERDDIIEVAATGEQLQVEEVRIGVEGSLTVTAYSRQRGY